MKTLKEFLQKRAETKDSDREKLIEEFEKEHGITNLLFDSILSLDRLSDFWYGGTVITFLYKDLEIHISAIGDVDVDIYMLDEEGNIILEDNVCDKSESGYLGDYLFENNIFTDKDLCMTGYLLDKDNYNPSEYKGYKAIIDYSFGNNNWFEAYAFDENGNGEYYNDDGTWSLSEVLDYDFDQLIKEICETVEIERKAI